MPFDLANCSLVQKMSMLVLGVALLVSIAIGGFGDLMLRRLASNLVSARLPSSVAALDRILDGAEATVSPVMGIGGQVVGVIVMRKDAGPAAIPASLSGQISIQTATGAIEGLNEGSTLQSVRGMLLVVGVIVFGAVAFIGMQIARGFLQPLDQLEKEVERVAKGDATVKLSALGRTDEIGQIARSVATVQESLAELARLKAEHSSAVAQKSSAVATVCLNLWDGIRTEFRNAKVLLASEGRMIAKSFKGGAFRVSPGGVRDAAWRFWKGWLTGEPSPARSAAA
jgi:methyl-accepting chemotaxis protein